MSKFDLVRMYWFAMDEISKDRDTYAGLPRSRARERRLRQLTLYDRMLTIHRPLGVQGGRVVCTGCVKIDILLNRTEYYAAPCEHVALIVHAYSDRPGFDPEWTKPYAWAVSP